MAKVSKVSISRAVRVIGVPTCEWPGNCAAVADAFLRHGLVGGKFQYGHYRGFIHPDSLFGNRSGCGFTHHAWILDGGTVIDPTRWVFEAVEPYVFYGKLCGDYDFGGNALRKELMGPAPVNDPVERQFVLDGLPESCLRVVGLLPNVGSSVSISQLFWVANLPLDMLGAGAKPVYLWLKRIGLGGLIPMDNKKHVLG